MQLCGDEQNSSNENQKPEIQFIAVYTFIEINMSSSEEEDIQQPTTPFKTIEHEPPTRHPTTNKKQSLYSPPHHTNPQYTEFYSRRRPKSQRCRSDSMRQSISAYKLRKYNCLQRGKYQQATRWQQEINRTKSMIGKVQLKRARMNTIAEQRSIRQAYHHQISFFESAWNSYFERFKQVEQAKIEQFKTEQATQIEKAREKLRKRCSSLHHADKRVIELQKAEEYHLRKGNIQQLAMVRIDKKKIINQTRKERRKLIQKWTKEQENTLKKEQSRKFQALISKLEERRKDQQQNYAMERKRLRQKYKNVLSQLRHEQKMTLNFVTRWTQTSQL